MVKALTKMKNAPNHNHATLLPILGALCGAAWGLGLARVLALELHAAFFWGYAGPLLCVLLSSGAAFLAARSEARKSGDIVFCLPLLLPALDWAMGGFQPWRGPVLLLAGLVLSVYTFRAQRIPTWIYAAAAILLPLAIYLPDLSPFVGRADTFEFQVVAPRLGIAHPSGYPLYILLGKLFSLIPIGPTAWRVNLSSAVFASLAAGALFWTLRPDDKSAHPGIVREATSYIALVTALTLAFSPTLWSRAIEAEVYALNACIVATSLRIAASWIAGETDPRRAFPALALLTGVGMAAHLTLGALVFLALPLALTLKPRPTLRTWLYAAALGLAGLALYLYIPLRWPAVTGEWMSPAQFLHFVTNADSGGALQPLAFWRDPSRWALVWERIRLQIGEAGVALALVGLAQLWWKRWRLALGGLLAVGAWVWFGLSFYVADPDYSAFLIPAHVMLISWMGIGMQTIIEWGARVAETRRSLRSLPAILLTLCALLPVSRLWITGPALDTRNQGQADEAWGRYALRQNLAEGAAILADSEKFPPLYYLQQVEGLRPDLELVTLFSEDQYRADMTARLAAGQRVYLARYLPGLDALGVSSAGPLVEVAPPAEIFTGRALWPASPLTLVAYRLEADPEGRAMHHLELLWQVSASNSLGDLGVQVQIRGQSGEVIWRKPATRPVGGYTTTQAWKAGQSVRDYHALVWPDWLPAGEYTLEVGVLPRFAKPAADAPDQQWFTLQTLTLGSRPATHRSTQPLNVHFGDGGWLTGADLPGEAWAGAPLTLDTTWLRLRPAQLKPARTLFRWVPIGGPPAAALEGAAMAPSDQTAYARRDFIPTPDKAGKYRLEIGWWDGETVLPVQCRWLEASRGSCPIGKITVGPANQGLANYNNQILLIGAGFNDETLPAGGPVEITLTWRALRDLEQNYTVFVQLIGPDGASYGQADSWPVQGARPTGDWQAGEEINDPYRVFLRENAPSGKYNIIVGWYLLADMSRLPVLDAEGNAMGDFYTVGEFDF
ncbi:MAG: DUF2723 domain-containing protein [Anaerolineae bacterium]|nr:DUF2723 domain-containing protein [Anaerolineae bacterium]